MRQMSYSLCRFWAYDESKKIIGAGASSFLSTDFATPACDGIRLRIRAVCYFSLINDRILRPRGLYIYIL